MMEKEKFCTSEHSMCNPELCKGKNKKCDYMHKEYAMRKWVFRLIIFVIFGGAIIPFASEVVCTIWFKDYYVGLNTWNQFVSIILGITATILSIVSIIMGFKNYEDTLSVQEKYMQALEKISNISKDISHVKEDVNKMVSLKNNIPASSLMPDQKNWGNEPKDISDINAQAVTPKDVNNRQTEGCENIIQNG